jgi:hypothetical protein
MSFHPVYARVQLLCDMFKHHGYLYVLEAWYYNTLRQADNGMQTLVPLATRVWVPSLVDI